MKRKILLVEDEAIIAMSTAKIIEKYGFVVVIAHTGEKAAEMVEEEPDISLILMDIDLGRGIDGTEAAQRILEKHDLPIIFHTSHAEKEYVDRVKKITGYGYVLKNSGEFVLLESINMAYTLFEAKKEAQLNQKESEIAYQEMEAREYRLQHVNRVLLSIRNINQIITKETDVTSLLDEACRVLIETSGYHQVWIVLMDKGVPQEPFYHSGFKENFSPMVRLLKTGEVPECAKKAIETEDIHIVTEPSIECPLCPFKDEHSEESCDYGDKVTMTLPLIINETIYGWISVILSSFYSDNSDEHKLFREIARDLSYALHNIKIEESKRLLARDLNLSQATLMTALDHSQAGIAIADAPAGKLRYVNDAALRIRGGNRKEIVQGVGIDHYVASWNILDFDGRPLDPDEVPLARALKYGEINSRQFIVKRDTLEERIVMTNAAPIYDKEGKIHSAMVIFMDVTEHKEAERKLIESEEKYKALYENAPLPYQSLDKHGNFIDVNPAWLTTLGYTREEVLGKKFSDFLHPSWKPHFEKNFPAFKKRGYVHDVQFKIRHKRGEYRDITFEGCIGYKPDGSVRQTYCVFKDITEQKRAEIKLQESKENLRITLNSIGDAVISTDKNGNVIHMNPIAEQLTGWDIDAAKGKMLKDVFHIINADTRKIVNNPAEKVIKSGDIVGLGNHTVLISKNEQEYQIADSAAPIKDDKGNINGVVLVFRDITEEYEIERQLKESEKKYRGLFNSIRDAILVTDTDRNILDCNPAFTDLFGYSLEDIRNKKTESVYQNEEEYVQMGKALREHKGDLSHFLSTVHYKRKDGRTFSGETNVFYLKDSYEKVTGFIGIIRDISERLQAEHMRKEREYRLQRTQEIAHIGNWDLDLKDTTLHWSDEIYRIFGMEPQQFKSTYHAFLERVHPEDREKVDAAYWNSIRDRKDVYEIEHRIVRKDDGTIRYVYEKCEHVKNDSGEILHSLGMVQDITESKKVEDELKKSKDRYKRLVHNSPNLIMETDIDTLEIINCNPAMANNLGYAIQEILGKRIDEFIPSDILKGRIEASQRAIETEESQILEDERRGKFFHTTYIPLVGEDRRSIQTITIDITNSKHNEENLRKAVEDKIFLLRELNHRVKNNLTMISSLISLKDSETDEDLSDLKHRIDVIKLVHEKLHQQNDVEKIEVKEYFQELLVSIFSSIYEYEVDLVNNIQELSIPTKTAIPLGLIVNEISTNAIKYGFTSKKEARFTIEMKRDSHTNRYVLLLSNTGNPFPEEIGLERTETMGLQLVSTLVAQLDGTIELQKKPHTKFTIRFPIGEE